MKSLCLKILVTLIFLGYHETFGAATPDYPKAMKEMPTKSLEAVSQLEHLKDNQSLLSTKGTKVNEIPRSMKEFVPVTPPYRDSRKPSSPSPTKREFKSITKNILSNKSELESTPLDIAEYIFWTGDETGVALALKDFLQDGWISKEDAIYFLERVETELKNLKQRYAPDEDVTLDEYSLGPEGKESSKTDLSSSFRENALEQIIYEIAKQLFTSVGTKSPEIIQQLAKYVETEGSDGRLDRDLEKSVLDILVTAFVESVKENDSNSSKGKSQQHPLKEPGLSKTLMTQTLLG